ncbi:unnamed protein product [Effrenium voratum]|nr:unnamed protein product [Effrenium voratum]
MDKTRTRLQTICCSTKCSTLQGWADFPDWGLGMRALWHLSGQALPPMKNIWAAVLLSFLIWGRLAFGQPWAAFLQDDPCTQPSECSLQALQMKAWATPFVAPSWRATVAVSMKLHSGDIRTTSVRWWYDAKAHRYRADRELPNSTDLQLPLGDLNYNRIFTMGPVCVAKLMFDLEEPFAWLASATRGDNFVVAGVDCTLWTGTAMGSNVIFDIAPLSSVPNATVSVCLAKDGVPREVMLVTPGARGFATKYVLSDIHVGELPAEVFAPSAACISRIDVRCADSSMRQIDLYRIHGPNETLGVENRNFGDAAASLHFLCNDKVILQTDKHESFITHWSIFVNTSFGLYRKCWYRNGANVCEGNTTAVGRQLALMPHTNLPAGNSNGQCGSATGVWYSVPEAGRCHGDISSGCTWADPARLRTVSAACVASAVCGTKGPKIEAFEMLLSSNQSGCPEVD